MKTCENCEWFEEFSGVCCNPDSDYRTDRVDEGLRCDVWEAVRKDCEEEKDG